MSKIEVDAIEPQSGTNLNVGGSGDTVTVPGNVVKTNAVQASDGGNIVSQSGTTITLGASGDTVEIASGATLIGGGISWQSSIVTAATLNAVAGNRSEERRVGKECRSGWWPNHEKKKE